MAKVSLKNMPPYTPKPNLNDLAVEAAKVWAVVIKGRELYTGPNDMMDFATFLGDPHYPKRGYIVNVDNPVVVDRLKKIVGPHGHTFLKIIEAQNSGDEDGS